MREWTYPDFVDIPTLYFIRIQLWPICFVQKLPRIKAWQANKLFVIFEVEFVVNFDRGDHCSSALVKMLRD